jgi:hypothetical protein
LKFGLRFGQCKTEEKCLNESFELINEILNLSKEELNDLLRMTATEDIKGIFSILHDGTISTWTGDKTVLTLTVECEYLAERINKYFNKFYVELFNVEEIKLDPWTNPIGLPIVVKTTFADIFKTELEILSAEIVDDFVVVTCNQHDTNFDYSGGNLIISCREIKIFDQNRKELTIDQLRKISKDYWNEWSNR